MLCQGKVVVSASASVIVGAKASVSVAKTVEQHSRSARHINYNFLHLSLVTRKEFKSKDPGKNTDLQKHRLLRINLFIKHFRRGSIKLKVPSKSYQDNRCLPAFW